MGKLIALYVLWRAWRDRKAVQEALRNLTYFEKMQMFALYRFNRAHLAAYWYPGLIRDEGQVLSRQDYPELYDAISYGSAR